MRSAPTRIGIRESHITVKMCNKLMLLGHLQMQNAKQDHHHGMHAQVQTV